MGIDIAAAVARHVLDAAGHPARGQPFEDGTTDRGNLHRIAAQRAVADHVMRARHPEIERRVIIDRDAHRGEFQPHRRGARPRGLDRAGRGDVVKFGEGLAARIGRPVRRAQPCDPSAFLIDRHQQAFAPVNAPQVIGQRAQLLRVHAVAAEQDVACRIGLAEEGTLVSGEVRAAKTEDRRNHARSLAGKPASGKRAERPERGKAPGERPRLHFT